MLPLNQINYGNDYSWGGGGGITPFLSQSEASELHTIKSGVHPHPYLQFNGDFYQRFPVSISSPTLGTLVLSTKDHSIPIRMFLVGHWFQVYIFMKYLTL